jgi:hypothetical protein
MNLCNCQPCIQRREIYALLDNALRNQATTTEWFTAELQTAAARLSLTIEQTFDRTTEGPPTPKTSAHDAKIHEAGLLLCSALEQIELANTLLGEAFTILPS